MSQTWNLPALGVCADTIHQMLFADSALWGRAGSIKGAHMKANQATDTRASELNEEPSLNHLKGMRMTPRALRQRALSADRFELLDDEDNVVAVLQADAGYPSLALYDQHERPRLLIEVDDAGGQIQFLDRAAKPLVTILEDHTGGAIILKGVSWKHRIINWLMAW